jgi:hypothetical protein
MRVTVVPVEGRLIRDPRHGRIIPPEGAEVVRNAYWNRARAAGDVTFQGFDDAPAPAGDND